MKKFLLFFVLFSGMFIQAQVVFCPHGASWNACYNDNWRTSQSSRNISMKYEKDTIIGTDTLKLIRHDTFFWMCNFGVNYILIKQKGDTIFFKNQYTFNKWQILFNYASLPGSGWKTSYVLEDNSICNYVFTVDSVKYVQENSFTLKQLVCTVNVDNMGYQYSFVSRINERYGWGYLFFYYNSNDGCEENGFCGSLCYKDNAYGTKYFSALPCDYKNTTGINELNNEKDVFSVYPTLFTGFLKIESTIINQVGILKIYDIFGRELKTMDLRTPVNIDLRELSKGIYFLMIFDERNVIQTTKIIKQD